MAKRARKPQASSRVALAANAAISSRTRVCHAWAWLRERRLLAVIMAAGLMLRSANLLWGLPLSPYVGFYHGDEIKSWESALLFPENYLSSTNFLYGTALQYSVGLLLLPLKFVLVYGLDQGAAYSLSAIVIFRAINVLLGAATPLFAYFLGCRLEKERVGLIAAALLAVAFSPVLHSALTTLDVPMGFLAAAGLLQAVRTLERPRTGAFVLLGIIAGALLGTKITGGLLPATMVPWLAWRLFVRPEEMLCRSASLSERIKWLLLLVVAALAVFVVSTPHIFLDWAAYLKFMQTQKQQWYDQAAWSPLAIGRAWWSATSLAIGAPTAALALGGIVVRSGKAAIRAPLLLFAAANYVFWLGYLAPRFVLPLSAPLCLFAALCVHRFLDAKHQPLRIVGVGVLAVALGWSLVFTTLGIATRWFDPRTAAARYIAQLPVGAAIGIGTDHDDPWQHHGWRYPRIDFQRFRDTPFLERPEYLVTTALELDVMQRALVSPKLRPSLVWDDEFRTEWYLGKPPSPRVFAFYQELFRGSAYEPVARFSALTNLPLDGGCPAVVVYRRKPLASSAGEPAGGRLVPSPPD